MELLEKVLRNERERRVLGRADRVVAVRPIRVVPRLCPWRYRVIWHDRAETGQFRGFGLAPEKEAIHQWNPRLSDRVNRFSARRLARMALREYLAGQRPRRLAVVARAVSGGASRAILVAGRQEEVGPRTGPRVAFMGLDLLVRYLAMGQCSCVALSKNSYKHNMIMITNLYRVNIINESFTSVCRSSIKLPDKLMCSYTVRYTIIFNTWRWFWCSCHCASVLRRDILFSQSSGSLQQVDCR